MSPLARVPGAYQPGTSRTGVPGGGLYPFSNSASFPVPSPFPGAVPPPAPLIAQCHTALTTVPFSVPVLSTTQVSGGGAALQTAITAAGPGTRLMIMDSLAYSPVVITGKLNLTIDVTPGETPSITAAPGPANNCIRLDAGNSGIAIMKLLLIGSGNDAGLSQRANGLINGSAPTSGMSTIDRVIIEDCTFSEPVATVALGAPGIQLLGTDGTVHLNVWIHRCTFRNNAAGPSVPGEGYGACEVSGFSNVYIQNSRILRDDAVISRALSAMRGFTWKSINVLVEACLTLDIGTNGDSSNFRHHGEGIFGTAIGNSIVRNCVAYNTSRGFRINAAGCMMTLDGCTVDNERAGFAAGDFLMGEFAGTLVVVNSVVKGAGDCIAFTPGAIENHNDVFNVSAPGKVLDPTDLTVDPILENPASHLWNATAPAVMKGASDGGPMGLRYQAGGELIIWCGSS